MQTTYPVTTPGTNRILSAPIMVNLELTTGCNMKCRHCYNFWRDDSGSTRDRISRHTMERLIGILEEEGVFHVVLTGGEPFLNFDVLEFALERLHSRGISTSVNSNLTLTTPGRIRRLADTGLDHILTSLNCADRQVNDFMVHQRGAFEKITEGIRTAVSAGIRVSANMILSQLNQRHVYDTARLCAGLGVQKLFATRLVPAVTVSNPVETDFHLDRAGALQALDDLLQAKQDFGIAVGTLISYPLCMLGDLEKYRDFVGRGCPAQRGNRMVVNANGEIHACTHEVTSYGNVFEDGIRNAFEKMRAWHDGSYRYEDCRDCEYVSICMSGCRSAAYAYFKSMTARDPLFAGRHAVRKHYRLPVPAIIQQLVNENQDFIVPDSVRFRRESGFYTINIRWANAYTVAEETAEFLIQKRSEKQPVSLSTMIGSNPRTELEHLVFKGALEPANSRARQKLQAGVKEGCSVNPECLPRQATA